VTKHSGRAAWLRQARSYLRNADPVLARIIDDRPDFDFAQARLDNPFGLVLPTDLFGALLFQITGQQLSVPATRRNLARVEALFGGHLPSATELMGVDPAQLRKAGLSWRKVGTLRDLKDRPRLLAHCTEINRLENVGDQLLRRAVARLFRESPDPIHVIKWKEIYDYLENAIDRCEDVANVIEGVALEYA